MAGLGGENSLFSGCADLTFLPFLAQAKLEVGGGRLRIFKFRGKASGGLVEYPGSSSLPQTVIHRSRYSFWKIPPQPGFLPLHGKPPNTLLLPAPKQNLRSERRRGTSGGTLWVSQLVSGSCRWSPAWVPRSLAHSGARLPASGGSQRIPRPGRGASPAARGWNPISRLG